MNKLVVMSLSFLGNEKHQTIWKLVLQKDIIVLQYRKTLPSTLLLALDLVITGITDHFDHPGLLPRRAAYEASQ